VMRLKQNTLSQKLTARKRLIVVPRQLNDSFVWCSAILLHAVEAAGEAGGKSHRMIPFNRQRLRARSVSLRAPSVVNDRNNAETAFKEDSL